MNFWWVTINSIFKPNNFMARVQIQIQLKNSSEQSERDILQLNKQTNNENQSQETRFTLFTIALNLIEKSI